jgi:ESF2/ABP1 family protein
VNRKPEATPKTLLQQSSRTSTFATLNLESQNYKIKQNMSIRKRNEFLDLDESDNEGSDGYQSDVLEESKGARTTKRRRVDHSEDEDKDDDLDEPAKASATKTAQIDARFVKLQEFEEDGEDAPEAEDEEDGAEDALDEELVDDTTTTGRNAPKSVLRAEKAARKSGVVYISRVPPFMKPHTLKHFLEEHAPKGLGRIFLTPEDHTRYLQRKKSGGNKKKSFTDGWVEFVSKNDAKAAAGILNGNIMGGKKGNYYHDDLWNLKYLKGFKWSHLTEQIASENAEREARLREEIRRTRKENKAFVEDVERGKALEGMDNKRKAKGSSATTKRPEREFKQAKAQGSGSRSNEAQQPDVKRALSMIF